MTLDDIVSVEPAETAPKRFTLDDIVSVEPSAPRASGDVDLPKEAPFDERGFQQWYAPLARQWNLDPNPDAPQHKYDYRQAYRAGAGPDAQGHWPSQFKAFDHPNRFVDGIDTITGKTVPPTGPPSLGASIGRGVDVAQSMGYGAAEWAGEAMGLDALAAWGRGGRTANEAEIQAQPKPEFANIDSPEAFYQWAKATFGEQLPLMAPSMAGGVVGGAAGTALGGPIGGTFGAFLGAAVPSLVLGVGETQGSLKQKDPQAVAPWSVLAGGALIAAFDTALPGKIGSSLARKFGQKVATEVLEKVAAKPAASLLKRTAKGVVTGVATEAFPEALQEAIGEVAAAHGAGQPIDPNLPKQMLEAFAAGGLMGGIAGGIEGAVPERHAAPAPPPGQSVPTAGTNVPPPVAAQPGTPAGDIAGQTEIQPPQPPVAPQAPPAAATPPTVRSEPPAQNVPPPNRDEALKAARVRAYEQVKNIADPEEMALTYERLVDQYLLEAGIQPFPRAPFAQAMYDLDVAEQDARNQQPSGAQQPDILAQPSAPVAQPPAAQPEPVTAEPQVSAPQPVTTAPPASKPIEEMTPEEVWALTQQDYANESDQPGPTRAEPSQPAPEAAAKPKKAKKPPVNVTKFKDLPADVRSQVRRMHRELLEFKFDQPGRQDIPWWDQSANEATVGARLPNAEVWKNFNEESRRTGKALINSIENYMRGDRATTIHPDIVRLAEARASGDLELSGWTLPHDAGDVGVIRTKPIREGKPDEAKEREVIEALERRDIDELRQEYEARFGKTYNADNMSELLGVHEGDQRWKHHDAVRAAAGAAVQALYNRAIQQPNEGDRDTIRVMGGGTGSGKSTGVPADRTVLATLDSTLSNYEQSKANIEAAKARGHYVAIVYVYRDPIEAWGGVIRRALDKTNGRHVTALTHASTHVNGPKTLARLAEEYADDPQVGITVVEKADGRPDQLRDPAWVAEKAGAYTDVNALRSQLEGLVADDVRAGRIDPATAAALGVRAGASQPAGTAPRGETDAGSEAVPAEPVQVGPEADEPVRPRRNAINSDALERALSPAAQKALDELFADPTKSNQTRGIRQAMEVYQRLLDNGSKEAKTDAYAIRNAVDAYLVRNAPASEVSEATHKGLQTVTGQEDPDPAELLENEVFASAREAGRLIFDTLDPQTASFDVSEFNTAFGDVEFRRDPRKVFPAPKNRKNLTTEGLGTISDASAQKVLDEWKAEAKRMGQEEDHSNDVIVSLFDVSGVISKPWEEAGFKVIRYDIKNGDDLMDFGAWMGDLEDAIAEGYNIVGVLAQPPCTSFAVSGARWWKTQHDVADKEMVAKKYGLWASEMFDTPLDYANTLVAVVKLVVGQANPKFYAMENPVGRIATQNHLPRPTLTFDPANFGDPYTKETNLWGEFDNNLPTANVEPTKGSYIATLRGDVEEQKALRSVTPEGFAYSFFMANRRAAAEQADTVDTPDTVDTDDKTLGGGNVVENFEQWGLAPEEAAAAQAIAEAMDLDPSQITLVKGGRPGEGALPQATRAKRLIEAIESQDFEVALYDDEAKQWVATPRDVGDDVRAVGRKSRRAVPQAVQSALDELNRLPYDEVNAIVSGEDVLSTGERQPRLPGAENVRDQEVELPAIAPAQGSFALEGGADERTAVQETLFGPPTKPTKEKKAKPRDPNQNVLFQQAENAPALRKWYYSNIEAALTTWQKKGTADQLLAHLKKFKGAMDEASEIGLDEWLKGRESVTRDEVREFLDRSRIEVTEVTKGGPSESERYDILVEDEEILKLRAVLRRNNLEVLLVEDGSGLPKLVTYGTDRESVEMSDISDEADDAYRRIINRFREHATNNAPTKYSQYQLPGGEHYREVLLTLPEEKEKGKKRAISPQQEVEVIETELERIREQQERIQREPDSAERTMRAQTLELTRMRLLDRLDRVSRRARKSKNFQSPHWDEPNVLAHIRLNDRQVDGKRVLFIEEIQSDWHQQGRKKGYSSDITKIDKEAEGLYAEQASIYKNSSLTYTEEQRDSLKRIDTRLDELKTARAKLLMTVPDAPFKGNAWKKLALKRVMALAAEGGYDGIAWTTGEQQNARYKLSTVVTELNWYPASFFEGGRDVTLHPKEGVLIDFTVKSDGTIHPTSSSASRFAGRKIDEVVGKDLAKQIFDEESGNLKGEGLDIGGSGMRGFYDRELPNIANDLVKKHGGKVGTVDLGVKSEVDEIKEMASGAYKGAPRKESVHYLDLPVSLREEIRAKGVPLFQGEKAAVEFVEGGQALIRAMASPDVSSAVHELAHVARRFLFDTNIPADKREGISDDDIKTAETWAGAENGWTEAAEEKFARGFERYLQGAAPVESLSGIFAKFKAWLSRIYTTLAGSSIDIKISPEMRNVYDKLVTRKAARERKEAAARGPKVDQILSPGAAADQFKLGERVVYEGKQYIVQGRAADRLRLRPLGQSEANERQVDARKVQSYSEQLVTRTVENAPAKPAKSAPQDGVHKSQWRKIGQNAEGDTLYEDDRGVRSKVSNGFRLTEAVRMHHVRQPDGSTLIQPVIGNRRNDYKLASELEKRSYASTQIELPKELADLVRSVGRTIPTDELAGDGINLDVPHVTVQYGLHSDDVAGVRQALMPIMSADTLMLGRFGHFEGDEADVVWVGFQRGDKERLGILRDAVRSSGEVTDTHPTYTPHVTVAYVKPGMGAEIARKLNEANQLEGKSFPVTSVVFSPSEGEKVTIELGESSEKRPTAEDQGFTIGGFINTKPTKREELKQAQADVDAEIDDLFKQIAAKIDNTATTGVDPELGLLMIKLVMAYIKKGVVEFRVVALNVQEKLGPKARTLDRHLELAWKRLRGEDVKVADVLTAGATLEGETQDVQGSEPDDDRGGEAGAGESGAPAGGDRDGRAGDVAGEQPESEEGVPGAPANGGKRRPPRRPRTARAGTEAPVTGDDVSGSAGADGAAHVDTADTVEDPDVADANARGERPRHFVISDEKILTDGNWVAKLNDNIAALELLKQLEAENRPASDDEQRVLSRYIGWGHTNLAPVVGPLDARAAQRDANVVQARQKLTEILTEKEFKELGESVINAHYSFNTLPRALWDLVGRLGFKGGSVLEPAIGTGHFFGTMPMAMVQHPKTRLFGVDKEPIAARIAKQLYQSAYIQNSPLEDATVPKDYFDLVISNVPFANVGVFDPAFKSGDRQVVSRSLHNYYFGKALDVVRPGGLVVFVTSSFTMNSKSDAVRKYLAQRAEFLGAIRLTEKAFQSTAGTQVVTDVIVLRRYDEGEKPKDVAWLKAIERDDVSKMYRNEEYKATTNEYFAAHPEMVMGKETMNGSMAKTPEPQYTVEGPTTVEGLAAAVARFPQGVYKATKKAPRKIALDQRADTKQGSFVWKDGKLYQYDAGTLEESPLKGKDLARAKAFIPIRDAYDKVLDALMSLAPDADLAAAQAKLKSAYDRYVREFGLVNTQQNARIINRDPNGPRVLALEDATRVKQGTKFHYRLKRLADIFTKRVAAPPKEPTTAESPKDALVQSLAWRATVDLDYMQRLTGKTADELTDALVGDIYQDPISNGWVTRDEYLSGDVVTKLAQAEARATAEPAFKGNVEALKVVQPTPYEPEDIKAPLGATWIPLDVYERFMQENFKPNAPPTITLTNNEARVEFHVGTVYGKHEFLPQGENLAEWFEDALNNKLPVKYSGTGKDRAKDPALTERYRESLTQLREVWEQWWLTEPDVSKKLTDMYNALFNRDAAREFDGTHLVLPNMNPLITLRPWQKNVIWRAIQNGNTGIFHAVGAGKTIAMIGIAGEMKRLGLANKPIIAVPNPLVKQWVDAFMAMYPTAKILAPTAKDFEAKNRRTFIAKVANNDWDAIIIAHSQFESISVKVETLTAFIQQQEDLLLADAADQLHMSVDSFKDLVDKYEEDPDDKNTKQAIMGRNTPRSVKDIVKAILRLRARLKKRLDQQAKDAPVVFEQLGVDALMVDEAHYFKNLYFPTSRNNIAGLKGSDSDRAMDMFLKVRLINEASKSRNVFFATGTPIANTMSEVYTVFRYLAQQTLDRLGMGGFDSWANNYATATAEMEAAPGGGYKERNRLRNWSNLRDLSKLFRRFADVFTAKDVEKTGLLKLPKVKNGSPTVVATNPHPGYEAFNQSLNIRIKDLQAGNPQIMRNKKGDDVPDNNLWITSDAGKAAIDLRLVSPSAPEDPNGRIPTAARKIAEVYKATADNKSTQFVFLDIGVPDPKTLPPLPQHVLEGTVEEDVRMDEDEDEETVEDDESEISNAEISTLNAGGRDLYSDLRRNLEKQGVKPDEIAFHHQAKNPEQEALLFQAVREGRIRVLISTRAKGGVGVNVQHKLVALHHLDVPWRPDQLEQADGRGIRQGNENEEVEIFRYVTKGTFDEFRWGLLAIKNAQILAFQRGEINSMEDIDPAQLDLATIQAIASGDPRKLTLMNMERELRLLRSRYTNYERRQQSTKRDLAAAETRFASLQAWHETSSKALEGIQAWAEKPTFDFVVERSGAQGYGYLSPRSQPLVMDWGSTQGRSDVSKRIVALLGDHNLYSPQLIAKAGPFDIWASKAQGEETYEGGNLIQAAGGTNVAVKMGDKVIGVAPQWMKADKEPPKYNQSLQAYLNVGRLEEDVRKNERLLQVYEREIKDHQEILAKTFPQMDELKAKERAVSALRVEIGIDKADPADVAVADLAKIVEEHQDGTIDAVEAKERTAAVYDKARAGNYIEKLEKKIAEKAEWAYSEDDSADSSEGSSTTPRRRRGSSGSRDSADAVGEFEPEDDEPPTPGSLIRPPSDYALSETRHAAFPEMLELAKALIDIPSIVRWFRKPGVQARFRVKNGDGQILLAADLFKKGNARQLAKALAHELGHLTDWLPDYTLKRGNLLGRLMSLEKFLKWTFTDRDGTTIKNKEVRAELIALSDKWRPWDPAQESESFRAYRHSSKELYADAISVLLNNPGLLERDAPIFYETFFKELDRKPDVKDAYFDLQAVLTGTPEDLVKRRRANVQKMFDEADEKAIDIQKRRMAEMELSAKDLWARTKIGLLDKNLPFLDREAALEKQGVTLAPEAKPRYLLEERNYIGGQLKAFTERHMLPIYEALTDADISWRTFGEALFYQRITHGDRQEKANPLGIGPTEAADMLSDIHDSLTEPQRQVLDDSLRRFRAAVRGVTNEAYRVGLISQEKYEELQENPAYATFRVVDFIEDDVSWKIYRQKGTLRDIQNVADATLLKTLATIRAIERQRMIVGSTDFLTEHFPADIQQAPEKWDGEKRTPQEPKAGSKQKLVYYYDKGRLRGKWVPENIAHSLNNLSIGQNEAIVQALRLANGKWFRPVFTTMNLGFQSFNVARDFFRTWKNWPGMTLGRAVLRYWQALPMAKVRAFGLSDKPSKAELDAYEDLLDAEEVKILSVTFNDLIAGRIVEDTQIEDTLTKVGVGNFHIRQEHHAALKPLYGLLDWIAKAGDFIETLPKAAMIQEYKRQGLPAGATRSVRAMPADTRSHIRRKIGSPDFLAGGTWKPVTNEIFLFSNAITQSIRADLEVAMDPKTRASYWWKTASLNIVPKVMLFAALLAAAGLDDDDEGLDDWLARALRGISEYDFTNYIPIPVGVDRKGNSIYIRVPQDDAGRLIGGVFWKALQGLTGKDVDVLAAIGQIADYTAGQFPGLTPILSIPSDVGQYLAGMRVYDAFRGRFLFTEREARAGGWPARAKFLKYEFQKLGGGIFMRVDLVERPRERTGAQVVLESPVISNTIGRWLRISNYGQTERLRKSAEPARTEAARIGEAEDDAVSAAIRELMDGPDEARDQAALHERATALVDELYPDAEQSEKNRQRGDILRKLRMGVARGADDPVVNALLGVQSIAEKVAILRQAQRTMSADEFDQWFGAARDQGVISDAVAEELEEGETVGAE